MPVYTYEAMNSVGQSVKGEVNAASSEEAITKVRAMGNFPTKIKEKTAKKAAAGKGRAAAAAAAPGAKRRKVSGVSTKLITQFTRQLSTLINAGLPILRSLRILEQQQKPGMMRIAIRYVADDVEGGATLSEAMARHPKAFDRLYTNMVRAGEVGGVLDTILFRLADFMEKSQSLKSKVKGAMIYPVAVISFACAIMGMMLTFVIPKFKDIFQGMGVKLPAITSFLLNTSDWVVKGGWAVLLGIPVLVVVLLKLIRFSQGGRYILDLLKLRVPIFGMIISKTSIARFSRTLGTLLAAGVPILEALTITAETAGNDVYSRALGKVREGIREGESFAAPLRVARIVDPMVINMIDVGEETGELDKMLNKVADTYDEEVDGLVGNLTHLLEPVMIIMLGLIIGTIVIALFMPLVSMIQGLGTGR
ncbi:MAG: type II secretion system F family protein [Phycisphaerae bacterium]|jgi:type IV pilus assembly protein PilC